MTAKTFAPVISRRTATWPTRMARYFDCTQWGGGYHRLQAARGAVVLNRTNGTMLDIDTGEVYVDERFIETKEEATHG